MPVVYLGKSRKAHGIRQLWWQIYDGEESTVHTALSTTGGEVYEAWNAVWTNNNSHYQLGANEFPVSISFSGDFTNAGSTASANIYLCDSNGQNEINLGSVTVQGATSDGHDHWTYYTSPANVLNKKKADIPLASWKALKNKILCLKRVGDGNIIPNDQLTVTITTELDVYNITVNQATGGTASASQSQALIGTTVGLTATPDTGYRLASWSSSPALTITNNQFTMPQAHVSITPVWEKINYTITKKINITGAGTITVQATGQYGDEISISQTPTAGYTFAGWTLSNGGSVSGGKFTMPASAITVTANYTRNTYTITKAPDPAAGGTISGPDSGQTGLSIAMTQTPATGYTFHHWTLSTGVPIPEGRFTMPAQAVTVSATYIRNAYAITARTFPEGAGVISCAGTGGYNDEITVSQTPAAGYYFDHWELDSGGEVTNGKFRMPDGAVTITAYYLHRSEAKVNTTTIQGGKTWSFSFVSEDATYTHRYRFVFAGKVTQDWQSIPAGQTMYAIAMQIPTQWAWQERTADRMTGGEFQLETYKGSTLIGTHVTGNFTYLMPEDAAPHLSILITRNTTVDGTSFANVGAYVQNHSGVRVFAVGYTEYQATIASIRIRIPGYEGMKFDRTFTTFSNNSCTFDSGILSIAGTNTIIITITDSRGYTQTETRTITVNAYAPPAITGFAVWRVDSAGDPDETGEKAKYSGSYRWTQVGSNAITRQITAYGTTVDVTTDEDWIFPQNRQTFPALNTALITYTVKDLFETATVTLRLDTRRFIMHFNAAGDSVAFGHAVQESPENGSGYSGTFEIDESMQVFIGVPNYPGQTNYLTLKNYILAVVNGDI